MPQKVLDLAGLSVMAAFGHPDDEGFGCGGAMALLVARGARITLVCATNGDVGEISDPALATPDTLAQVRQEELRQAMAVTGVQDLRFLGYRDSGMPGTADNNHPGSLHQAGPDQVAGQLVSVIREVRPEVVITHDPTGGYGHPDHKAVYRHATQAFSLAGDATAYPEQVASGLQPWTPRLLYYACIPRSNLRRMWQRMKDSGITPPFAEMDVESLGSPDEDITTVLDVGDFVDTKIASLNCHRTQMDPNGPLAQLPPEVVREFMGTEHFTLAVPEGGSKVDDLLANL